MSSRVLRWLVLGFACLWFGMLVPVHQRGQIKTFGNAPQPLASPAAPVSHCSRAADPDSACHKRQQQAAQESQTGSSQPEESAGDCAVCHYILGLHVPPAVTFVEARLGLAGVLPHDVALSAPPRHPAMPFHGLDPPPRA